MAAVLAAVPEAVRQADLAAAVLRTAVLAADRRVAGQADLAAEASTYGQAIQVA
ncbi:hypothetical protein GCM10027569_06010 [Flindersiella endophytica]